MLKKEIKRRERVGEIIVQVRMSKELIVYLGAKVPDDFHIFSSLLMHGHHANYHHRQLTYMCPTSGMTEMVIHSAMSKME